MPQVMSILTRNCLVMNGNSVIGKVVRLIPAYR